MIKVNKKFCTVLIMLLFILVPVSNMYANELANEETEKGESFAEYTERIMREKAEAAGMTYKEYMQMQNIDTKDEQATTAIDKADDKEFKLDMPKLLIAFLTTVLIYTVVPVVIRICHKTALDKKKAFKIALTNSIIIGSISAIITINAGGKWVGYACVLYFFINRFILSYKGKEQG